MINIATTSSTPSTIVTLLAPPTPGLWTVTPGRPGPGEGSGKFVSFWPIDPLQIGEGLASEDWGQLQTRWFLYCTAPSMAEAQWLANQIVGLDTFGDRWVLESVGSMTPDDAPAPAYWFVPVTIRDLTAV